MKTTILVIFLTIWTFQVHEQKFEKSENYVIVKPKFELDSLFWKTPYEDRKPITIYLVPKEDTTNHLQEFKIQDIETFGGVNIYSLKKPGLENISEIIMVEFEFVACCSSIDCHYFLLTEQSEWIKLPLIGYVVCDGPEPFEEYRFPNQKFGLSNSIIKTISFPNQEYKVDSVKVEEILRWDGKKIKKNN